MLTDAHVHVWTDDRTAWARAAGAADLGPARFTPSDFLRQARPAGVGRAVLIQMSFYGFDNSYMLEAIRSHPGIFSGVAQVNEASPDLRTQMERLRAGGVRGFRIGPGTPGVDWLDSEAMDRLWRSAMGCGMAICPLIDPEHLATLDARCERFPDTRIVVDHLARIGMAGPVTGEQAELLCRLARHPNVVVKVSAFYALGSKRAPYDDLSPLIERVYQAFGPRRLMWGSDSPFQCMDGHSYADSLALVRERLPFLGADDRDWLLGRTADAVFFSGATA